MKSVILTLAINKFIKIYGFIFEFKDMLYFYCITRKLYLMRLIRRYKHSKTFFINECTDITNFKGYNIDFEIFNIIV